MWKKKTSSQSFFLFLFPFSINSSRSSLSLFGIVAFFFGLCIASPLRCASFFVCRDFCIPPLTLDCNCGCFLSTFGTAQKSVTILRQEQQCGAGRREAEHLRCRKNGGKGRFAAKGGRLRLDHQPNRNAHRWCRIGGWKCTLVHLS